MRPNFRTSAVILVGLVAVLGIGGLGIRSSMGRYFEHSHPSDAVLEANFNKHEADFESLAQMSRADQKVVRITSDFTWLDTNAAWPRPEAEWGFSKERWDQYRSLFKKLGLQDGIAREKDGEVTYFIASSKGLITHGTDKGYAYCKNEVPTTESLDDVRLLPKGHSIAFKKLMGYWYLFYMSA